MTIEVTERNGVKIIVLSGEIDMYTSPALRKELLSLVKRKATPLLVDFNEVSYIDSSGIATFVEALKGMMVFGGTLKLFGIPAGIMEIFNFSKLDRVFSLHGTIDDALRG